MRLKQFLYLQTVAECKSITKAAEKLFISHQALSYALQKLEETYKATLLIRTPYGILLTPEGEEFLEVTRQILNLNDYLTKRFDKISNTSDLTGELNIVAPDDYILSF